MKFAGTLSKMISYPEIPVRYELPLGEVHFDISQKLGQVISLRYSGQILCIHCGKKTRKSYNQGYCFPCSIKLAECDLCILKPETCHYSKGSCRQPTWGEENCFKPHVVYLANSSGLKVGITRRTQIPIRWIDQGATQALPMLEVKDRLTSGLIETVIKKHISDKTDWRKMLKGPSEEVNLQEWKEKLLKEIEAEIKTLDYRVIDDVPEYKFSYPALRYPEKVTSLSFDKTPEIQSILMGIKGQYLIFENGVFNVRAHTGYEVTLED